MIKITILWVIVKTGGVSSLAPLPLTFDGYVTNTKNHYSFESYNLGMSFERYLLTVSE